ncbi:MAG: CPBP family intramembrane glutamic endopeptidase, partial [Verrucomicrobiota bacterium]
MSEFRILDGIAPSRIFFWLFPMEDEVKLDEGVWNAWMTLVWGLFILFVYMGAQTLVVVLAAYLEVERTGDSNMMRQITLVAESGYYISLVILLAGSVGLLSIAGCVISRRGLPLGEYLALRNIGFKAWLFSMAAFLATWAGLGLAGKWLGETGVNDFMVKTYQSAEPMWLLVLAVGICAPFFEEAFFRGFIFAGLVRSKIGVWGTIFGTSFVWALIHSQYEALDVGIVFVLGVL